MASSEGGGVPRLIRIWFSRSPFLHQDAEGARRDLGVQRAVIVGPHPVELGAVIGDQPGEHVDPADRALGVGDRRGALLERQALEQRHDVDAALLEHRPGLVELELMHGERVDLLLDRGRGAGQEARAHPVAPGAEAQVQARRLQLVRRDRQGRRGSRGCCSISALRCWAGKQAGAVAGLELGRLGVLEQQGAGSVGHRRVVAASTSCGDQLTGPPPGAGRVIHCTIHSPFIPSRQERIAHFFQHLDRSGPHRCRFLPAFREYFSLGSGCPDHTARTRASG